MLDALGVDQVHVIGYSMGAITAARLLGLEPRLRSVSLCGTGPSVVEGHAAELLARNQIIGGCFQSNDWDNRPEAKPYRAYARLDRTHDFASIGAALIALEPVPIERLERACVPALVLNGGDDNPDDAAARLAALIPGAIHLVAGSGNHGTAPSDDEFIASLVSFLATLPGTTLGDPG